MISIGFVIVSTAALILSTIPAFQVRFHKIISSLHVFGRSLTLRPMKQMNTETSP